MDEFKFQPPSASKRQKPRSQGDGGDQKSVVPPRSGYGRNFTTVDRVLSQVVNKLGLDRRLKEHALLSLWPTVVAENISIKSRPLFVDFEGNIVIAVKDASIAQELVLLKPVIMDKLRTLARGLGLEVKGLRCDLKQYHTKDREPLQPQSLTLPKPDYTEEQLSAFTLDGHQLAELARLRSELATQAGANHETTSRILSMYEREMRIKHWRCARGLPLCPECTEPSESFHGRDNLCRDCYFASMAQARDISDIFD